MWILYVDGKNVMQLKSKSQLEEYAKFYKGKNKVIKKKRS